MMCKYVSFFGSIAVGKTTAGKEIEKLDEDFQFIEEDLSDNPYIEKAYEELQSCWGFLSSLEMLRMMSYQFEKVSPSSKIVVLDNGIQELLCYARLQKKLGIISDDQFSTLERLNRRFLELTPEVSLFVYFYCSEDIQFKRISSRGRDFEQDIDEDFIGSLNLEYEKYVASLPQDKVLKICTDEFSDYSELAKLIKEKLSL